MKWEYPTGLVLPETVAYDKSGKNYFYVAAKSGGLMIFDASDISKPVLTKTFPVSDFNSLEVMNVSQSGSYLYLALGNFFGKPDEKPGLAIIDVTDPAKAFITDEWEFEKKDRGSAVIIADGDYAYLGAMTQGLVILDVSDKGKIKFASQLIPDKNFPKPDPNSIQAPNARGMALKDNLLFLCYDAGGIRVIDVTDKSNPYEFSRYINQKALNKQQAYNNIVINENTAYAAIDYCGLEILDISDVKNIKQTGWWNPWDCNSPFNLWFNSKGHTNQIVYDDGNKTVFLSAGGSELSAVDVSDPSNPKFRGSTKNKKDLGCWGVEIHQQYIFLTYITAFIPFKGTWSGIKIFEMKE